MLVVAFDSAELVVTVLRNSNHVTVQPGLTDKGGIRRQIEPPDRQTRPDEGGIERLVYELYGRTDEEITIVEEATQ